MTVKTFGCQFFLPRKNSGNQMRVAEFDEGILLAFFGARLSVLQYCLITEATKINFFDILAKKHLFSMEFGGKFSEKNRGKELHWQFHRRWRSADTFTDLWVSFGFLGRPTGQLGRKSFPFVCLMASYRKDFRKNCQKVHVCNRLSLKIVCWLILSVVW